MPHVEKFAQKAASSFISANCGIFKPYKDPKFLEIIVMEENDKTCLIGIKIQVVEKATSRVSSIVGFQVWKSFFGAWVPEQPGTKIHNSYLTNHRGKGWGNLHTTWIDEKPQRTITEI